VLAKYKAAVLELCHRVAYGCAADRIASRHLALRGQVVAGLADAGTDLLLDACARVSERLTRTGLFVLS